jgi:hypothetical protein
MTQIPASVKPRMPVAKPKVKVLPALKGIDLGLYDSGHKASKSVKAYKVVDVSEFCPECEQCIIKYAKVTKGTIAQICDRYEKGKDLGLTVHWHINQITERDLVADEVFLSVCRAHLGVEPKLLAKLIYQNK